jgi:methanogenic corrinoid protein MtbC1
MDIPPQSAKHLLKAEDEMQLADDIAFLAQWEEGVENVTAVTLQEKAHGLVICLASNHTPSDQTVRELNKIMALVSEYSSEGRSSLAK